MVPGFRVFPSVIIVTDVTAQAYLGTVRIGSLGKVSGVVGSKVAKLMRNMLP
jgi:hypothetical protein